MKACIKCNDKLEIGTNWSSSLQKSQNYNCKPCLKKYRALWYQKNKERRRVSNKKWREGNKQRISETNTSYRNSVRGRAISLLTNIRARAKKKGFDLDIDADWIEEKLLIGKCEATGIEFQYEEPKGANSPSIDRRDNSKGYTKDNCQVVSYIYNMCKGHFDHETVLNFCRNLLSFSDRLSDDR